MHIDQQRLGQSLFLQPKDLQKYYDIQRLTLKSYRDHLLTCGYANYDNNANCCKNFKSTASIVILFALFFDDSQASIQSLFMKLHYSFEHQDLCMYLVTVYIKQPEHQPGF